MIDKESMNERHGVPKNCVEESICKMIQAAGPRPEVCSQRADRVNKVVSEVWRRSVKHKVKKRRSDVTQLAWASAACFLIAIISVPFFSGTDTVEPALVAHVSVVNGVGYLTDKNTRQGLSKDIAIYSGQTIHTEKTSGLALRLEDNQSLRLDQKTRLRILSKSTFELERGAVYFDSGDNMHAHSINIQTDLGVVSDIGTQFEVRFTRNSLRVRVREGEVNIGTSEHDSTLIATQELSISKEGKVSTNSIAPDSKEWQWTQSLAPILELDRSNLDEYLQWLTRENGWQLHYATQTLEEYAEKNILHGSINGMTPRETLMAVAAISEITFDLDGRVLSIYPLNYKHTQ